MAAIAEARETAVAIQRQHHHSDSAHPPPYEGARGPMPLSGGITAMDGGG